MKTDRRFDNATIATRDLDAGQTFSVAGRRGTIIRCVAGQAWVTQEGDAQDYFLAASTRYQSAVGGTIVVNALVDATRIAVLRTAATPQGDWRRSGVRLEARFFESAQRLARRERSRMMAALSARARWFLRRGVRRLADLGARALVSLRGQRSAHQ